MLMGERKKMRERERGTLICYFALSATETLSVVAIKPPPKRPTSQPLYQSDNEFRASKMKPLMRVHSQRHQHSSLPPTVLNEQFPSIKIFPNYQFNVPTCDTRSRQGDVQDKARAQNYLNLIFPACKNCRICMYKYSHV